MNLVQALDTNPASVNAKAFPQPLQGYIALRQNEGMTDAQARKFIQENTPWYATALAADLEHFELLTASANTAR